MNLVLGAVRNMQLEHIVLFLLSLRQSGFQGRLALYVSGIDGRTKQFLAGNQVELLTVEEHSVFTSRPVNTFRYFVYHQYLAQHGAQFDKIMLTDVRDVYFQRDPFAFELQSPLACFLEDAGRSIGSCVINSGWIAATYGKATLEAMAQRPISCSGTTIGEAPAIREYIEILTGELQRLEEAIPNVSHVLGGMDQSTHNYLLHAGRLPQATCYPNEAGPVYTMNYVAADAFHLNAAGEVEDQQGRVPNILHQFDRHPELVDYFIDRYKITLPSG